MRVGVPCVVSGDLADAQAHLNSRFSPKSNKETNLQINISWSMEHLGMLASFVRIYNFNTA